MCGIFGSARTALAREAVAALLLLAASTGTLETGERGGALAVARITH